MARSYKLLRLLAAALAVMGTLAQEPALELRGAWSATTATQTLGGAWGAEISPRNPDSTAGYWTLLNDAGERMLSGTWSARRTGSHWNGTWMARTTQGRSFSGVWDADIEGSKAPTFVDMLRQSFEREVAGTWRSGRYSGSWWIKGSKNKNSG